MGRVQSMTTRSASFTGQVAAEPWLVHEGTQGVESKRAFVVFPLRIPDADLGVRYAEVIVLAGAPGDEPVTTSRIAVQALTELKPGATVRMRGAWDQVRTLVGGKSLEVDRLTAQEAWIGNPVVDPEGARRMGMEGRGYVLRNEHLRDAVVAEDLTEPLWPQGEFEGQGIRPLASLSEASQRKPGPSVDDVARQMSEQSLSGSGVPGVSGPSL